MQTVIDIENLSFSYQVAFKKRIEALKELTLAVAEGDIVGFLGANGAGKTTTIKLLLGLLKPDKGNVFVSGEPAGSLEVRRKIGYLPELAYYYRYLTSEEILRMYGGLFGLSRETIDERIDRLLKLVELDNHRRTPLKYYSKGMLHRIGLAQALINDPQLLIFDEPTSGLDPPGRMKVRQIVKDLKNQGKTIFFSSHELSEVELVCDKVAIIEAGRLISYDTLQAVLQAISQRYGEDIPNKLERYFLDSIRRPR